MTEYIDREAAYQAIADNNYSDSITLERYDAILESIGNIPAADVRPVVHGKWVYKGKGDLGWFECSICSYPYWSERDNYCPRCGADLREAQA